MDMSGTETTASVVLVHGAWADGSSWSEVIKPLQSRGLKAMAAPIPLTSLSDDVAALERALERTDGPLVLVAHAYAGAVIGAKRERKSSLARLHCGAWHLMKARPSAKCSIAKNRIRRRRNWLPQAWFHLDAR